MAIVLLENHGLEQSVARQPLPLEGVDEAFGREDVVVDAVKTVVVALGVAIDESPEPARLHVHLVDGELEQFLSDRTVVDLLLVIRVASMSLKS